MKLVLATRNKHKLEEIKAIFNFQGLEISSAFDYPEIPDVEEDGDTLEANAIKKAVTLAKELGCWAMADDSGLEVDALDGAPGVYSARYAGEDVSYEANNVKLLAELKDKTNRAAAFRTVIALSDPEGNTRTVEGRCDGAIIDACRGEHGFGYDPLFVPAGYEQTFAELASDEKNRISHRARALKAAEAAWSELLK
ncbi:XTP/dITP diphosphatase [Verrucomicrobiota bacterium]